MSESKWTDEQYIDWLFKQEPCGYQNTPGFRAFLLDAMATIGERPRAGDVASMHMAYTAGKEHGIARTWTDERPSEPGEYWLSIQPAKRAGRYDFPKVIPCDVSMCANAYLMDIGSLALGGDKAGCTLAVRYITGGAWIPINDAWFDGAKWSRRETPADPFEEVTT